MTPRRIRRRCRDLLLASVALAGVTSGAAAKDMPATAEGAEKIRSFLATYAGKSAAGSATTISVESNDYLVAIDFSALMASLKNAGFSYEPAIAKYKVIEQDDGAWRVEQSEFPAVTGHSKQGETTIESSITLTGVSSVFVLDPAISWERSAQFSVGAMALGQHSPGVQQQLDAKALKGDATTTTSTDGAVSTIVRETVDSASMTMHVDPKAADPAANSNAKPVDITATAGPSDVAIKLAGVKPGPLLDLWAFLVAHPSRAELAAVEPAFKTLLTAALATQATVGEDLGTKKLSVATPKGPFDFEGAKLGLSLAAAGPASVYEQHFAATGLTIPPDLVPPAYQDLVPTSFDLGFKVSGFDLTAAGNEAIADMHLDGDGPPISAQDKAKVSAKLRGAGPIVIDIALSHIRAPQLDVSFEGRISYVGSKPTGAITLRMHDFDKSVTALKALGPDAERQMVPVVAMAKGLAKTDPGGVMTWVGELGVDGIMKVNGLPLGKAPF